MSLFSKNWPYLACSIEKANLQYSNYPCLSSFSITNGGRKVESILNLKRLGWGQTLPCTKIHLKVKSKPETEGCFRCTWIKCLAPSVAGESFRKRKNCYHLHTFESNFTVLWKNVDTRWCSKQTDLLSPEPYVLVKGSGLASLFLFDSLGYPPPLANKRLLIQEKISSRAVFIKLTIFKTPVIFNFGTLFKFF